MRTAVVVLVWLATGALLLIWLRPGDPLGVMKVLFLGPAWCAGIAWFAMKVISPGATPVKVQTFRKILLVLMLADLALWMVSNTYLIPPAIRDLARVVTLYPILGLLVTYVVASGRSNKVTGFRHPMLLLLGFVAFPAPWLAIRLGWVTNPLFGLVLAAGLVLSPLIFRHAVLDLFK